MKKLLLILCFLLGYTSAVAQDTYTVNGETLQLKTEIDGQLDLLWNVIDGKYRYFVRTSDNTILELKNTKSGSGDYLEEYKSTLQNVTSGTDLSTHKVNLTLGSLRNFIDKYNGLTDLNYNSQVTKSSVDLRLGIFGGISNSPFVGNDDNIKTPVFGVELEILEGKTMPRHSGFLQLRHTFDNDDFQYSTTELSLGYRFRVINTSKFGFYGDVRFATLNFSKATISYLDEDDMLVTENISDTAFDAPFIFGIGADFKITDNSYIFIGYNQLFAAFLDNQGNFSTDITLGYKLSL